MGRDSHINRRPVRGSMPPPPIPIDPALDSFSTSTVSLSPGIGLDHLLQSPAGLHERLSYPGGSNNLESFPQNVQLPSMRPTTDLDPNPLCRFYNESGQSGPWTSQRIAGDMNQSNILSGYPSSYARLNHPLILPSQYRESPRSDIGSSTTGRNQPDSGYGTRSITTKSVRSTDYIDQGQSCQSLSGDVGDLQIYPEDHFPGNVSLPTQDATYFDIPNDIPTNLPEDQPAVPLICDYPECKNYESKNQSEHK